METITAYLHTPLFCEGASGSLGFGENNSDSHVPREASIIKGEIIARHPTSLLVKVTGLSDRKGKDLGEVGLTIEIPMSKVDHIVHEA